MSVSIENTRVLIVDTSTAMLHVLKNFSNKHGYDSDCYSDPAQACSALALRFKKFDADYRCVLIGWPEGSPAIVSQLLDMLASTDHQDLPVVLICQKVTTEIHSLVKRRPKTRALLWKDYQSVSEIIDRLALVATVTKSDNADADKKERSVPVSVVPAPVVVNRKVLLLDNAPSVCRELRDLMEANGYSVSVATTLDEGRKSCRSEKFDLVVADFNLRGEGGEQFCRNLQSDSKLPGRQPVCVMLASKYSDNIVKRSLAVGAIACLYKDESTEMLFTRIDALARVIPATVASPAIAEVATTTESSTEKMLEQATSPSLLIDSDGKILGVNRLANELLGGVDPQSLIGRRFDSVVCSSAIKIGVRKKEQFLTSAGNSISVTYIAQRIKAGNELPQKLITFAPQTTRAERTGDVTVADTTSVVVQSQQTVKAELPQSQVSIEPKSDQTEDKNAEAKEDSRSIEPDDIKPIASVDQFKAAFQGLSDQLQSGVQCSVLMLDIQLIAVTGDRLGLGYSEPMLKIVYRSLARLYQRENSFHYLGDGQFALILATRRQRDALVLARKLLQVVPQMVKYLSNMVLVSHGAMLHLDNEANVDADDALKLCRRACVKARDSQRDNAVLVMPMNKYLSAETAVKKSAGRDVAAG